jgi:DNA-binding SARP family transcriptional activator/TolB-like protein/Tfp pilus assembly protein PilF
MAAGVSLCVLGGFALQPAQGAAPVLPRKTRALLAVLAVEEGRPVSRERIGEMLWPGREPEQSRSSLREALYRLRQALRGQEVVASGDGGLMLGAAVATDVGRFRRLAAADSPDQLREAAEAYRGRLLDGFSLPESEFHDWLVIHRTALEKQALAVLARIADRCVAEGDFAGAMAAAERMFELDRVTEQIHWRLLEACRAAGRRAEALRHYAAIVDSLRRELEAVPGQRTRELVAQIRREMDPPPQPARVPPEPAGLPPPVAVLPFGQLGGESLPSHLADGLMVDIVCQLAGLRELQAISHGSTLGYRDATMDVRRAGTELGARYVVRGSMRRRGDNLRLTTELVDAGSGTVVWADNADAPAALDFAAQDRLVARIVNTLAPQVQQMELRRIRGKRPESLSVYETVLLAREQMLTYRRGDFEAARALLDLAVTTEPTYAEAHALLADWHSLFLSQGWTADRETHVAAAEAANAEALAHDRANPRALVLSGHRRALYHRDYAAAQDLFRRALEAAPGSASAWLWSSYTYSFIGDAAEALRRARHALELSPRDREAHDFYSALCVAHYTAGEYEAAVEWGRRCMAERSYRRSIHGWTAAALAAQGRLDAAREVAEIGMKAEPSRRVSAIVRNHAYRDATRREAYGAHLLAAGFPE